MAGLRHSDRAATAGAKRSLSASAVAAGLINDAQNRDGGLRLVHITLARRRVAKIECFGASVGVGNARGEVTPALGRDHKIGGAAGW